MLAAAELPGVAETSTGRSAPAAIVAGLIVTVAGVLIRRAVAYAVTIAQPVSSGLVPGLWLGIGLVVGELLTPRTAGSGWLLPAQPAGLLLMFLSVCVTWWTAQYAELSVRAWPSRSLIRPMLLGLAAIWLVFAFGLNWRQGQGHLLTAGWWPATNALFEAFEQGWNDLRHHRRVAVQLRGRQGSGM
ncbi:hypothetical protein [Micromonospora radicis]|uniref:Uncharacterized protein n=1 Tax=Micromonospora radicis TaxID=1894971 RepID=A0A418MSQ1_9ACTN|nr:hypothetical protein [Micromonospora radicis]RIV37081.1 hypothetical protein D2L64_17690 [Micromonospora radicis]